MVLIGFADVGTGCAIPTYIRMLEALRASDLHQVADCYA